MSESLPLLLLPGLMCDEATWAPLYPWLSELGPCATLQHGGADSIEAMAAQVLRLAPPRFALAGHSMGGRVAIEVLRQAPERVAALALLDTGYQARAVGEAGEQEAAKRHELLAIAREQGVRAMAQRWVQGMVHPGRLADAALVESVVAMFERKGPEVFAAQIRALLGRPDATPTLRGVRVPTLVLCGRQDAWAPVAQHEAIAALVPGARLVVVDDAGHMSPMERPEPVARALCDWWQACAPALQAV